MDHGTISLNLCVQYLSRFLTPPPTSTDVERLFSRAGNAMPAKRSQLNPHRLDRILFIRENILALNFGLEWEE